MIKGARSVFNDTAPALPFNTTPETGAAGRHKLHYIASHLIPSSAGFLLSLLSQTSSTVVLTVLLASSCLGGGNPFSSGTGGRLGTLPVGAARSQRGVLLEQWFAGDAAPCTRCDSAPVAAAVAARLTSCSLPHHGPGCARAGTRAGMWAECCMGWRCGDASLPVPSSACAAQSCACWGRFPLLPGLALRTVVKPFPSLLMRGFTACCNEPLKGKTGGENPVCSTPPGWAVLG